MHVKNTTQRAAEANLVQRKEIWHSHRQTGAVKKKVENEASERKIVGVVVSET